MGSELTVREYLTSDKPLIAGWLEAHGSTRVNPNLLPPVGVVVMREGVPLVALWCHLSVNIGIAFLEAPVSAPGLKISEASKAFALALAAIEAICRTHDYGLLVANTLPGIARFLENKCGFQRDGERVQLVKLLHQDGNRN